MVLAFGKNSLLQHSFPFPYVKSSAKRSTFYDCQNKMSTIICLPTTQKQVVSVLLTFEVTDLRNRVAKPLELEQ